MKWSSLETLWSLASFLHGGSNGAGAAVDAENMVSVQAGAGSIQNRRDSAVAPLWLLRASALL